MVVTPVDQCGSRIWRFDRQVLRLINGRAPLASTIQPSASLLAGPTVEPFRDT